MPKFKIGDRVRVHPYSYSWEITGTVIRVLKQLSLIHI